jgi:hypothetical protein
VANTTKIEDKLERKKLKRAAPRGSAKKKVKKLARGQSKR